MKALSSSYQLTIEVKKPGMPPQSFTGNLVTFEGQRFTDWDKELATLLRSAADQLTTPKSEAA